MDLLSHLLKQSIQHNMLCSLESMQQHASIWFTHSVELDLAKGVIHAKIARQVWEDSKTNSHRKNTLAIYQIQKSLASLSQGTMTVSTYFKKLKNLWDELDTYRPIPACNQMKAHIEQREEDRMMQFLMGLMTLTLVFVATYS